MVAGIGRTMAWVGFVSYGLVLALEWWRPGFVTYFWNPGILLVLACVGLDGSCLGPNRVRRPLGSVVFLLASAIVAVSMIWLGLPSLKLRVIMSGIAVLLLLSFAWKYSIISKT